MTQQTAPFIETKYGWDYGESGWNGGMDENLLKFSYLFDRNVDAIVNSLPSATSGSSYFLTTDNRLYFAVGNSYYSSPVPKWFTFYIKSNGNSYQFNGTTAVIVNSESQVEARLDAVEVTLSNLGTAALRPETYFASQSALDVASSQANSYADTKFNSLSTDLANSLDTVKGAALIGYKGRNLRLKLGESLSVADFSPGAVGTPGVDNTINLQNAIDLIPEGGVLNIPAGQWDYTHLQISKPITLQGAGGISTVMNCTSTTAKGIEFSSGAGTVYKSGLSKLFITSTVNCTAGCAVWFGNLGHSFVEDVYIQGLSPTQRPYDGIIFNDVLQTSIVNLQINDCARRGISVINHCVDLYWTNCRSDNNGGEGIYIQASEGQYFSNVTAYLNTGTNWRIAYGAVGTNKNMFFSNCVGDSSGAFNWLIDDLLNAFFVNCWGVTQKNTTLTPFACGFFLSKAASGILSRLRFTNCIANNNNTHGWSIIGADKITLVNSVAEANGIAAPGSGVFISGSTNVRLVATDAQSNTDRGVTIGAGCAGFSYTDSNAQSNTNGAVSNSTTGVIFRNVVGYLTANTGAANIASGATTTTITHGLAVTPIAANIQITPTTNTTNNFGNIWVSNITSTNFVVNVRSDPGASGFAFNWSVTT